jgi:hypothetical protein
VFISRKIYSREQIISKLPEAEACLGNVRQRPKLAGRMGSRRTPATAGKIYGGMQVDQARRLKDLEKAREQG